MCKLVKLTPDMEQEYFRYINEWVENGEKIVPMSSNNNGLSFSQYLKSLKSFESEDTCPGNFVPGTTYFYADGSGRILGAINIRHRLNDYLMKFGGHIGYGIRPSERRKGHAEHMLALALRQAKTLGIKSALVTCDSKNTGSSKTILHNGGVLENEVPDEGRIIQRYWIEIR
ncbi:MAG TPA: GNAT family N-acetyltransferase [Caproiciproducens sp.]|nr:GNAT family N-acetyltransferase [Caproiciproducens sp.]